MAHETCWIVRVKTWSSDFEYQEVLYDHDTTQGRDTKTLISRGQWVDSKPSTTAGQCGSEF